MVYDWKSGSRFAVDPQPVGEELEKLGSTRPEDVVAAARKRNSVMHDLFEWDDASAAEEFRLLTAQQILRCITTTFEVGDETIETRAWECVKQAEENDEGEIEVVRRYVPITEVLQDDTLLNQVLKRIRSALVTAQRELREYNILSGKLESVSKHVASAIKGLDKVKKD